MKIGMSSYSFLPLLANGSLSVDGLFDWLSANGAEHLEIATFSFAPPGEGSTYDLASDEKTLLALEAAVARTGIPISGFCLGADMLGENRAEEIAKVKRYVDLCARFGVNYLRHDIVIWGNRLADTQAIENAYPMLADACREIAEYGASKNVVTSVENHGFVMVSAERLTRLHHLVNHPNFKLTVDVGNFLCVDDNPYVATKRTLPLASFVHFKDFYMRQAEPGPGWLKTAGGEFIRGSVLGYGDLDIQALADAVIASGYDGFVSLEYEGGDPTLFGCEHGLNNLRRFLRQSPAA
ncbi:sugar phosphate isomerase/epimerase [Devosia sp. MC532]|uniref:sugar phosphate isomerase/epimerase family protein n=1 Tax=Devosia sp. MC532 TaxID=2799788 RepID=UPI0018F6B165|nr:sugar phosphate isomerase/epimerase family protein [Devosia sp. MC532]MBJ7578653.1 sugar phosphate isomerase/epimerase [Devosia sp. MC532]